MGIGIRDFVKQISPPWLAQGVAEKLLYIQGLAIDANLEKLNQGMRAHMPGYGDATALPYVGTDRLIGQGLSESNDAYALRLKYWLDDWQIAGSDHAVLQQVLGYVSALAPLVRTVTDGSVWNTYIPLTGPVGAQGPTNGPSRFVGSANWNWDNEGDPHAVGTTAWWRWWLVLFATPGETTTTYAVTAASNTQPIILTLSVAHNFVQGQCVNVSGVGGNNTANGAWRVRPVNGQPTQLQLDFSTGTGTYTGGGTVTQIFTASGPVFGYPGVQLGDPSLSIGFATPPGFWSGLDNLVNTWKAAHSWCRWIIVSFDTTLFDPAQPADGVHNPAGDHGPWAKILNNEYVPCRFPSGRYVDGVA